MNLIYNSVPLKILTVSDYLRHAIFDEGEYDYLYDEIGIRCQCWLNPGATFPGLTPTNAERALAAALQVQRATLVISMNDSFAPGEVQNAILTSPIPGMSTDCRNGPICKLHGIMTDHGNGSLVADIEFATWTNTVINDAVSPVTNPALYQSIVLSNRWKYTVDYNKETYAEMRRIDGTAYFRMDVLNRLLNDTATAGGAGVNAGVADYTREFLVPPPINGFQRRAPTWELSPGGDVLRYVIEDEQQPKSFPLGNQHRIASINVIEGRKMSEEVIGYSEAAYGSAGSSRRKWW